MTSALTERRGHYVKYCDNWCEVYPCVHRLEFREKHVRVVPLSLLPYPSAYLLQISGNWYSVALASDKREKIEEHGSMRVFVEHIQASEDALAFKLHTM